MAARQHVRHVKRQAFAITGAVRSTSSIVSESRSTMGLQQRHKQAMPQLYPNRGSTFSHWNKQVHCSRRSYYASSAVLMTYNAKAPTAATTSWERSAKLVKNTTVQNKYLEHIRDIHSPEMHVKTMEDEIKGTMGMALAKQAQKIESYTTLMQEQLDKYQLQLLNEQQQKDADDSSAADERRPYDDPKEMADSIAKVYNGFREEAIQARWQFIVHRQAVGFITDNQKLVFEKFPIEDALPEKTQTLATTVDDDDDNTDESPTQQPSEEKKQVIFGDQLDWWEKIGRWK
jgi:hypothetical protein